MFIPGTTATRRNHEVKRLNEVYQTIIPTMKSIQKCLKHLCQRESYRMLKDWSYEAQDDPLPADDAEEEDSGLPEVKLN